MAQTSTKPALGEATKKAFADTVVNDITELYAGSGGGGIGDADSIGTSGWSTTSDTYVDTDTTITLTGVVASSLIGIWATGSMTSSNAKTMHVVLWVDGSRRMETEIAITSVPNIDMPWATHVFFLGHGGGDVTATVQVHTADATNWVEVKTNMSMVEFKT